MNCEYCEREVEKGSIEIIETMNLKFFVCGECMLFIEDKFEEIINKR